MNISQLTTPQMIAIAVGLLLLIAIVVYLATAQKRRSSRLRAQFGPEYDRAVAEGGDLKRVEAKLAQRADRVKSFHLRTLSPADRANFLEAWNRVQAHFVDAPADAVAEADTLLGDVMSARGYPVADFEQRAADISVDHPTVVQNYRTAHEIALRHLKGQAGTEDLRKAMIHYRALFEDLVSESAGLDPKSPANVDIERGVSPASGQGSRGAVA
jgi:hypothetical protein